MSHPQSTPVRISKIIKSTITRLIDILYWPCWLHELCHYIPAKLYGFEPTISRTEVRYTRPHEAIWACVWISLAPSLVGLGGWLIGLVMLVSFIGWQMPLLAVWTGIALAWQVGCLNDFYQLWQVLREPKSPDYLDTIVDDDLSNIPNITNLDTLQAHTNHKLPPI